MNRYAYFDVLALCHEGQGHLGGLTAVEIPLLAYVGFLLWLFRDRSPEDWGYTMAATASGAPYSSELEEARDRCEDLALLVRNARAYRLTNTGEEEFLSLKALSDFSGRAEVLEAAAAATLVAPIGLTRRALTQIPELSAARDFGRTSSLLSETAVEYLRESSLPVREAIGDDDADLLVPAVVWLNQLLQTTST